MSTALPVVVTVGAMPPGHLTPVNVADPLPPAACVNISMKDLPAVAVGIVNVQPVLAVRVAVKTVPLVITNV